MLSIKDRFINVGLMAVVAGLAVVLDNTGLFGEAIASSPIGYALGPGLVALIGGGVQFLIDYLKGAEKKPV